jgi:hypothetical protein
MRLRERGSRAVHMRLESLDAVTRPTATLRMVPSTAVRGRISPIPASNPPCREAAGQVGRRQDGGGAKDESGHPQAAGV